MADYTLKTPEAKIKGCHLFPLGGFEQTATWRSAIAKGQFELTADGFNLQQALESRSLN